MRNLKAYPDDSFEFFQKVVKNKRNSPKDPTYKSRLMPLENSVKDQYSEYDKEFGTNTLQSLKANGYTGQTQQDLIALYSYNNSIMQDLKNKLTTNEFNRKVNTCQHCTIGEVNSFDHMVPKSEFAEFAVHPKNLIPSCSKCNGYKSNIWRKSDNRIFLNLYLDALPQQQYLFVDLDVTEKDVTTSFYLNNRNNVDPLIYNLLEQHYDLLELFIRFNQNVDDVVDELEADIRSGMEKLSFQDAKDVSISSANRNKKIYGSNYWKSILEIELLDNLNFCNRF